MRENERKTNGTEEKKIMRRETIINDTPIDRVQYTMDFIKVITGYNFRISNVKIMLKYIKAFMYFNGLHVIDIDITDSDVSPKCIYLVTLYLKRNCN